MLCFVYIQVIVLPDIFWQLAMGLKLDNLKTLATHFLFKQERWEPIAAAEILTL